MEISDLFCGRTFMRRIVRYEILQKYVPMVYKGKRNITLESHTTTKMYKIYNTKNIILKTVMTCIIVIRILQKYTNIQWVLEITTSDLFRS